MFGEVVAAGDHDVVVEDHYLVVHEVALPVRAVLEGMGGSHVEPRVSPVPIERVARLVLGVGHPLLVEDA